MNEKIKRLLPNPFAVDYIGTDEPIDIYTEKEMLEFAQLIIQKCGQYLDSPEFIGRSDLDWSMVLNEYFGIKNKRKD